jgi:hypothetical protein
MCGEQSGTGKTFRPSNSAFLSQYLSISPIDSPSPLCCSNQKETYQNLKALKHSSILSESETFERKALPLFLYNFITKLRRQRAEVI